MRKYRILLFTFFFTLISTILNFSYAQFEFELDSIKNCISPKNHDTVNVNILLHLAESRWLNPDSATYFIDKAYEISDGNNYLTGMARSLTQKSNNLIRSYKYEEAKESINEALRLSIQLKNDLLQGKNYSYLAMYYNEQNVISEMNNNILKAKIHFQKAIYLYKKNNTNLLYETYRAYGLMFFNLNDQDSTIYYFEKAANIAPEIDNYTVYESSNSIRVIYLSSGQYNKAIELAKKSLDYWLKINDSLYISLAYTSLADCYSWRNYYAIALEYRLIAFTYIKNIKWPEMISNQVNNIGWMYFESGDYVSGLKFSKKALDMALKCKNDGWAEYTCNIIGACYSHLDSLDKAIKYFNLSNLYGKGKGDNTLTANNYGLLGEVYLKLGNKTEALRHFNKALEIYDAFTDQNHISYTLAALGDYYLIENEYAKAIQYADSAYKIALKLKSYPVLIQSTSILQKVYDENNNIQKAYQCLLLNKQYTDSLHSIDNEKKIIEVKLQSEFKESMLEREKEQARIDLLKEQELNEQKLIRNIFVLGFILILIFIVFIYRNYMQKQRINKLLIKQQKDIEDKNKVLEAQKDEISAQRDEVEAQRDLVLKQKSKIEEANIELTDSIEYANYIQSAILPQEDFRKTLLPDHSILFKPKNIVSGDFYWLTKVEERVIVAAADCTGHGVPGAFMSMLGVSFLNDVVNKEYITHPGVILRRLRKEVIHALKQKGHSGEQRDGMDIALCSIDFRTLELQFSGANNPLYIIRRKEYEPISGARIVENSEYNLYEIKGDKMPIAIHERMDKFKMHELQLINGDCLYMFSDGFADQFGGMEGKKFKYKPFKEVLLANQNMTMEEQINILNQILEKWKGNFEQVDDILIIGFRI